MKNTLWYFGLESVKGRYTQQLSEEWMPYSFERSRPGDWEVVSIPGKTSTDEILVGQVLDGCGRSLYSLSQCQNFIKLISEGKVKSGDILYFQDFWTPGIEGIFYSLEMYNIQTRNYAMLHAQSVDEYDFMHKMRHWARYFELGIDKKMTAIFVGSQIHKNQLREAGFESTIHVLSLPFGRTIELNKKDRNDLMNNKKNQVVFASRFDFEKNPLFMLSVAERFLENHKNWEWILVAGTSEIRSNDKFVVDKILELEKTNPRFRIKKNISKETFYDVLAESKIQFNSSLQDYVSWILLEAATFKCDVVYPNFRSFPEILPESKLYQAFNAESALKKLDESVINNTSEDIFFIPEISELGLMMESHVMFNNWSEHELNIWQQKEYCKEKFGFLLLN